MGNCLYLFCFYQFEVNRGFSEVVHNSLKQSKQHQRTAKHLTIPKTNKTTNSKITKNTTHFAKHITDNKKDEL
jgi:hypothetical protein